MRTPLVLTLLLFLASGCDLFDSGRNHDPITISGTVVLAETAAPLAGVSATIIFLSPPGIVSVLSTTRTDAAGRFTVTYDPPEQTGAVTRGGYDFRINSYPYDNRYTTGGTGSVNPGTMRDLGTVQLSRNPLLP